jgi:hypothetical protein
MDTTGLTTIRWTIRVAGLADEGDLHLVNLDSPFVQGCLKSGRCEVVKAAVPAPVEPEPVIPVGEPGAEGLTVPAPKLRNRAHRQPK